MREADNVSAPVGFQPVSTTDLPYEGPSARDARRWARGVLAGLVDEETIEAVVVCFSELVTNTQVHTRPSLERKEITCRLRIATVGGVLIRGEVIDAGSPGKTPTTRRVNAHDEDGRGLSQVVNGYADAWGYEQTAPHEYVTWFQVHDEASRGRAPQECSLSGNASSGVRVGCYVEHPGLGCRGQTEEIRRRQRG